MGSTVQLAAPSWPAGEGTSLQTHTPLWKTPPLEASCAHPIPASKQNVTLTAPHPTPAAHCHAPQLGGGDRQQEAETV